MTSILENFGCRTQRRYGNHLIGYDVIYRFAHHLGTHFHQSVVYDTHIVGVGNRYAATLYDTTGIYLVCEEKGCYTRLLVAVHNSPIERSSTTILRQQRSMQVESTHWRHIPHHLGQHTEGYHNLQMGIVAAQLFYESFIFQSLGLQHRQSYRESILLDGRKLYFMTTSGRFIGHCYHCHHIISTLYEQTQGLHCKVGSTHIYYTKFFFCHISFSISLASSVPTLGGKN